ncbi:MAG: M48 family metallopeptidase [Bacteroidales bacterium]|nr:M48 family metallopeptidase [Bacteroidales bacterium]
MKIIWANICVLFFLLQACSTVPLTGRRQMLLVSDQEIMTTSLKQYNDYLKTATLSQDKANYARVERVGKKIANATEAYLRANGLESQIQNFSWEFKLVKDKAVNAFCMPGGKIVVYEGLLPYTTTDDELAVVIGHEVAHAVARHANERMSQQLMTQYGAAVLGAALSNKSEAVQSIAGSVYGLGAQYGLMLPYSRKHEYEADYMGLIFLDMAGYKPEVAITFWQKMAKNGSNSVPEFMSTHPSDEDRIAQIRKKLPEIKNKTYLKSK